VVAQSAPAGYYQSFYYGHDSRGSLELSQLFPVATSFTYPQPWFFSTLWSLTKPIDDNRDCSLSIATDGGAVSYFDYGPLPSQTGHLNASGVLKRPTTYFEVYFYCEGAGTASLVSSHFRD